MRHNRIYNVSQIEVTGFAQWIESFLSVVHLFYHPGFHKWFFQLRVIELTNILPLKNQMYMLDLNEKSFPNLVNVLNLNCPSEIPRFLTGMSTLIILFVLIFSRLN